MTEQQKKEIIKHFDREYGDWIVKGNPIEAGSCDMELKNTAIKDFIFSTIDKVIKENLEEKTEEIEKLDHYYPAHDQGLGLSNERKIIYRVLEILKK